MAINCRDVPLEFDDDVGAWVGEYTDEAGSHMVTLRCTENGFEVRDEWGTGSRVWTNALNGSTCKPVNLLFGTNAIEVQVTECGSGVKCGVFEA